MNSAYVLVITRVIDVSSLKYEAQELSVDSPEHEGYFYLGVIKIYGCSLIDASVTKQ